MTDIRYEFTNRALLTGIVLGVVLTPCNIYSGLKIGWSFNMSITSALLSFAFWKVMQQVANARPWGLLESNINQTTASSAASIISGGLVAPIPALALVAGVELPWYQLIFWVFSVSFLGIWVAYLMLDSFLNKSSLPLPAGVATAQVITDIFSKGREALLRVYMLAGTISLASAIKLIDNKLWALPRLTLPGSFTLNLATGSSAVVSFKNLTFFIDPSPLLIGFGAIIGPRIGLSLLLGAILAWGLVAPEIIAQGWVVLGDADPSASWFATTVEWLLWPGVALMVASSITSFVTLFIGKKSKQQTNYTEIKHYKVGKTAYLGLIIAATMIVVAQMVIFQTSFLLALIPVPIAFVLAIVAARVVGETGIPPIGAIGQVSQLTMGMAAPNQIVPNLTGANVAGGTAGQCADLLNDFKTGQIVGATPLKQIVAQCFGVLTGSIIGSLTYLALIPEPTTMLITEEWPAPAVVTWKAVAETLQLGLSAIPYHAQVAMMIGALVGIIFSLIERYSSPTFQRLLPSAPALGLAFVIPASISIAMCIGGVIALILKSFSLSWSNRFLIAAASGLVAGESITGVLSSIIDIWF